MKMGNTLLVPLLLALVVCASAGLFNYGRDSDDDSRWEELDEEEDGDEECGCGGGGVVEGDGDDDCLLYTSDADDE